MRGGVCVTITVKPPGTATDDPPSLSVDEAAAELRVARETIRRVVCAGDLDAFTIGSWKIRVLRSSLDAYLKAHTVNGEPDGSGLLTITEAVEICEVSRDRLWRMINGGVLKAFRVERDFKVYRSGIAWLVGGADGSGEALECVRTLNAPARDAVLLWISARHPASIMQAVAELGAARSGAGELAARATAGEQAPGTGATELRSPLLRCARPVAPAPDRTAVTAP